jgi:polar amino acid transport system substrate-binding protein
MNAGNRWWVALPGLVLAPALTVAAPATLSRPVMLVADNWCPQHCEGDKTRKGYVVDIVEQALAAEGVPVTIVYRPWIRALRMTEAGSYDGLLTPTVKGYPQFRFHQEAVGYQQYCFYVNASSGWTYSSPSDLLGKRIAHLKESGFGELEKYMVKNKDAIHIEAFAGSHDVAHRIFQFLGAGRADAIIMTSDVHDWGVRSGAIAPTFRRAGCLAEEKMSVGLSAVSPERARLIGARLDSGIRTLRQSGKLKLILDEYGIMMWPAGRR